MFLISNSENLERSDLNPIEEAKGYEDLIKEHNYTQEKVAKLFSKSRPYIANFLRLAAKEKNDFSGMESKILYAVLNVFSKL